MYLNKSLFEILSKLKKKFHVFKNKYIPKMCIYFIENFNLLIANIFSNKLNFNFYVSISDLKKLIDLFSYIFNRVR